MRFAVFLAALGLVATCASAATAAKSTSTKSRHRQTSHSRAARRNTQQRPSPERYQEIQQALASRGYYKGTANGAWGDDSVAALKRFQTDQNLPPDGKLTSLSLIAMGLGPKRSGSSSTPPATSGAPATVQSNPAPASQGPAEAH